MDTLKLCRAMEAVCVQHALSDTRLRERWLDLMDDWNIRAHNEACQSALDRDPGSASKRDPFERRVRTVALAPSELAGVAETERARACA